METQSSIDINRIRMDPWIVAIGDSRAEAHTYTRSKLATLINYSEFFLKHRADLQAFKDANSE